MASFYQQHKSIILAVIIITMIGANVFIGSQTWFKQFSFGGTSLEGITSELSVLTGVGRVGRKLPDIPSSLETTVLQNAAFLTLSSLPHLRTIQPLEVSTIDDPLSRFGEVSVTHSGIGNSLIVTWEKPFSDAVTSTRLYRSTTFGTLGNVIAELSADQRSFKDTNVVPGTTYFYSLRGIDATGKEATQIYQYPGRAFDIIPPPRPSDIQVTTQSSGTVTISWNEPDIDDFDFARVYRSTLPGQLGKLVGEKIQEGQFTDTTNVPGVTYYYTVTSVDTSLNESSRDTSPSLARKILEKTGILAKGDILLLITNITARGVDTGNAIALEWTNPADSSFDHVRIYRSQSFNTVGTLLADLPQGANTYTDNSIARETTYYYTLRTVDVEGRESDNSIQYVAVARDVTGPAIPRDISVGQEIPSRVTVAWSRPADPDLAFYRIYRSTDKVSYGHLVADRVTAQSWVDEDIKDNQVYYYVVTSVDASGNESAKPIPTGLIGGRIPFIPLEEFIPEDVSDTLETDTP